MPREIKFKLGALSLLKRVKNMTQAEDLYPMTTLSDWRKQFQTLCKNRGTSQE